MYSNFLSNYVKKVTKYLQSILCISANPKPLPRNFPWIALTVTHICYILNYISSNVIHFYNANRTGSIF